MRTTIQMFKYNTIALTLESIERTYTYVLTQTFERSTLLKAITPKNVNVLDILYGCKNVSGNAAYIHSGQVLSVALCDICRFLNACCNQISVKAGDVACMIRCLVVIISRQKCFNFSWTSLMMALSILLVLQSSSKLLSRPKKPFLSIDCH